MPGNMLQDLLNAVRLEAGHSIIPSMGVNDVGTITYLINRTQNELATAYDWPNLVIDRDIDLVANQRYYQYPQDLPFENVNWVWVLLNQVWNLVEYGIYPEHFAIWNSDLGFISWPVQRWMHNYDSGLFECWPIPSQAGNLRMRGMKEIPELRDMSDECTLDPTLITLFTSAELLARENAKDAPMKLQKAQSFLRRMQTRQTAHKRKPFVVGGGGTGDMRSPRIGIDYIPPGYGSGPTRP
jgi:hypothetical protein